MERIFTQTDVADLMNGASRALVGRTVPGVPGVEVDVLWTSDRQTIRALILPRWKDLAAVWPARQRTYAVPYGCQPEAAYARVVRVVRDRTERWTSVARIEALARQWCLLVGAGEVNRVLCALEHGAPPWPQDYARMTAAHRAGWTAWYRQQISAARAAVRGDRS